MLLLLSSALALFELIADDDISSVEPTSDLLSMSLREDSEEDCSLLLVLLLMLSKSMRPYPPLVGLSLSFGDVAAERGTTHRCQHAETCV